MIELETRDVVDRAVQAVSDLRNTVLQSLNLRERRAVLGLASNAGLYFYSRKPIPLRGCSCHYFRD